MTARQLTVTKKVSEFTEMTATDLPSSSPTVSSVNKLL